MRKRLLSVAANPTQDLEQYESTHVKRLLERRKKWQAEEALLVRDAEELLQAMNVTLDNAHPHTRDGSAKGGK